MNFLKLVEGIILEFFIAKTLNFLNKIKKIIKKQVNF